MLDWTPAIVLAMLTGLRFWMTEGGWLAPIAIACLAFAIVAIFPPLWRGEGKARWRTARRLIAALLAAVGLFLPIETHAVMIDMPSANAPR
jgi:hypothetical protein